MPTDRAISIMQALDLAEDGTFLCCVLVLVIDVAHLICKLSERSGCGFVCGANRICLETRACL